MVRSRISNGKSYYLHWKFPFNLNRTFDMVNNGDYLISVTSRSEVGYTCG